MNERQKPIALPCRVVPVILSGGSGSRLWPLSRQSYPKQLWPLLGEKTLIQETALRSQRAGLEAPIVVCSAEHRFIIAEQLRDIGITHARIMLEPVARNSAPAAVAAAHLVAETDPEAMLWIMAADAAIDDQMALIDALNQAVEGAQQGRIVTFGIQPTHAETGYGYIERGAPLTEARGVFDVVRFIEKPDKARAEILAQRDDTYWNSGMFVVSAGRLLEETKRLTPELYETVGQAVAQRQTDLDFIRLDREAFARAPTISIDYAIIERTPHVAVVPSVFGWSDIGSWDALWALSDKDTQDNAIHGDVICEQTRRSYVRSEAGLVTVTVGVDDLIVVATQDAVLVAHRDAVQEVKEAVMRVQKAGHRAALSHNRVYRPWGFYEGLTSGLHFHVKRIVVHPGQKLSLQKHRHRAEHWVVVEGKALVTKGAVQMTLEENESVYLPIGTVHRLENPTQKPLTLIEVQSGAYLGEDDITRFEDAYRRLSPRD